MTYTEYKKTEFKQKLTTMLDSLLPFLMQI